MRGIAYGARSAGQSVFGIAVLDVRPSDYGARARVAVATEEPYASEIAEAIARAATWEDLPEVEFEEYQVVGEGR